MNENKIYNSYDIATLTNNNFYIEYVPATKDLASHYAYWATYRIDGKHLWRNKFTVTHREQKHLKLQEAIAWTKEKYGLDCSEKDPFGAYQVVGTMAKIQQKIAPAWNKTIQELGNLKNSEVK
ncbi:MAG: hypothetical protein WC389_16845 [Lutibacter sp.]